MKFVEVKELPPKKTNANSTIHSVKTLLEEFMNMNIKFARVEYLPDEYSYVESLKQSFTICIRRFALPINVHYRMGNIYLSRRDL